MIDKFPLLTHTFVYILLDFILSKKTFTVKNFAIAFIKHS